MKTVVENEEKSSTIKYSTPFSSVFTYEAKNLSPQNSGQSPEQNEAGVRRIGVLCNELYKQALLPY